MTTYTYELDQETGHWNVVEHNVAFAGLSENEARETVETLKRMQAKREAMYRKVAEAQETTDAILHKIA